MADNIHYITWYTVYSAKTGEVVAAGTSSMCAAKLGYKTANSFASSVGHRRHEKRRPYKYIFEQERIDRAEVDCLPPIRRYCKKKGRAVCTLLWTSTGGRFTRGDIIHDPKTKGTPQSGSAVCSQRPRMESCAQASGSSRAYEMRKPLDERKPDDACD